MHSNPAGIWEQHGTCTFSIRVTGNGNMNVVVLSDRPDQHTSVSSHHGHGFMQDMSETLDIKTPGQAMVCPDPEVCSPTIPGPEMAGLFPLGRSRLMLPPTLTRVWQLLPDTSVRFQVEIDGVLKHQAPAAWSACLIRTKLGMRTILPKEVSSLIADTFCCGWRRSQDGTLILVMSSVECRRLTIALCLVSRLLLAV